MKILITGANGLVGQHLVKLLLDTTSHHIIATGRNENRLLFNVSKRFQYFQLDIADGMAVAAFCAKQQPEVVIHAAAMTQADECEEDKIGCWNANVTATRFLIEAVRPFSPYFIFLSTDFVFDGLHGPYTEADITGPVNYYGSSKVAAEKDVLQSGLDAAVIRTCLVYGNILAGTRNNIINWVKESLQQGKRIKVVADQWRTPTYIEDLVKGILLLINKKAAGIFNIAGKETLTPYDMALATAAHFELDASLIEKVSQEIFTQPAKRPAKTGFVIAKAIADLGYTPLSFAEALQYL